MVMLSCGLWDNISEERRVEMSLNSGNGQWMAGRCSWSHIGHAQPFSVTLSAMCLGYAQ